jgi:hypothetical protein
MSPTLADVYMITGLDISGSVHPWDYRDSTRQPGVKSGSGYKHYIQNHMKDGPLGEVEYTQLAGGKRIPLGKYLLGSAYHMLDQTVTQMYTSQKIACVNGPWWFVQMWLQLHMHQIVGIDLNTRFFPSSNYHEGEVQVTRGCHTYGEAASTVPINQNVSQLFELFFKASPTLSGFITWTMII